MDLRLDNILVSCLDYGDSIIVQDLKVIDFGSSFCYNRMSGISSVFPEIMPPEVLKYTLTHSTA